MEIVVATQNRGKFTEISEFLKGLDLHLIPLWSLPKIPPVPEDQETFRGNALKKARDISLHTGKPSLADDSGLVVESLGGAPGIYSARYAGEGASDQANLEKLLREMENIPDGKRDAHYVCSIAVLFPEGKESVIEERCEGVIAKQPRGTGGFGYDPIFLVPEFGKTMAELPLATKNRISHRGKALQRLRTLFENYG